MFTVVCYEYGDMGEVTKETRIYALSFLTTPVALNTQFTYDASDQLTFSSFCLRPSLPAFDSIQPRLFSVLTIGKQSLLAQRTFAAGEKNLSITPPVFIIRNPIPDNVIQINESTP